MITTALKSSFLLTFLTTGTFLLFGYIYSIIEKRNTKYLLYTFGSAGILFTGVIGTTIHELGHLIMCIIFKHKITDFQLFNFKGYKYEETLGYVSHRYNENSIYQQVGNFFIGVGPIISGTLFIILSFRLLLPHMYSLIDIQNYVNYLNEVNLGNIILLFFSLCKSLFLMLFNIKNLSNINFYIFIYLMTCVSTHISLSKKDFQNSIIGIFSIFMIYFIVCLFFIIFNFNLNDLLISLMNYNIYLLLFLSTGLVFSLISFLFTYIFYVIKK